MFPRRTFFRVSFWLVIVCTCLLVKQQQMRHIRSQKQPFGRYTEHDATEKVIPIIEALLPHRNDLYLNAYYDETAMADGRVQHVWNVDCTDSRANDLVHIVYDAASGEICWMADNVGSKSGYDDLNRSLPNPLTSQMAAAYAQRWMRTMGFRETWKMQGVPRCRFEKMVSLEGRWQVTLEKPGWRAHLSIDVRTGRLMYATILATR
jgi:hypothetical protein